MRLPNAACIVAMLDRLVRYADILTSDGDSYDRREASYRCRVIEVAEARRVRHTSRSAAAKPPKKTRFYVSGNRKALYSVASMPHEPARLAAPPIGTQIRGIYELCRFLGAGSFGAVYEARAQNGKRVALKALLHPEAKAASQKLEQLFREEQSSALLSNPHIVTPLAIGTEPEMDMPFIVTPLLLGTTLGQLLNQAAPLYPMAGVRLIHQACQLLQVVHEAGVIHGNIKPQNLFLEYLPTGEVGIRLLDLGLGEAPHHRGPTGTASLLDSALFMAPERVKEQPSDERTDVWHLGAVLYQALCGQAPFERIRNTAELAVKLTSAEVPCIQTLAPWLDPSLTAVIHGALLRDRSVRCPNITALANALRPFAGESLLVGTAMLTTARPETRSLAATAAQLPEAWSQLEVTLTDELTWPETSEQRIFDPLVGIQLGGKYRLIRTLGRGGMGTVYEAIADDGEHYAVKLISSAPDKQKTSARRRFLREARATMKLDSEHVVHVIDAETDEEQQLPYIVMEMLQGMDLAAALKRSGPFSPAVTARLFLQASRGIAAAHDSHLIHRDIKPSNLFLHEDSTGRVVVKVCDFGIVKKADPEAHESIAELTKAGSVLGSPRYMSPEQVQDATTVDIRTDIWSLGVSLYHALRGKPPWRHEAIGQLLFAISTEPAPQLQEHAPWVPPALAEIVHKTLERDPEDRFQTMHELAEALEPFCEGKNDISVQDLVSTPKAKRKRREIQLKTPSTISSSVAAQTNESVANPSIGEERDRRWLVPAMAATVIAGVTGAILLATNMQPEDAAKSEEETKTATPQPVTLRQLPTTLPTPSSLSAPTPPRRLTAQITIYPSTAKVKVNGTKHELDGNILKLTGEPGDTFVVEISQADQKLKKDVILSKEGAAAPDLLVLPARQSRPTSSSSVASAAASSGSASPPPSQPSSIAPTGTIEPYEYPEE